jgi:hypothetical protein
MVCGVREVWCGLWRGVVWCGVLGMVSVDLHLGESTLGLAW